MSESGEQAAPITDQPPVAREAPKPRTVRLWAAVVLAACLTILGVAAYLSPDPRGYGTHEQLGSGPCGMLVTTGLPCPTCGMTTAFAYAVRGQWHRALYAQPAGFILALATGFVAIMAASALLRGRPPGAWWRRIDPYHIFAGVLVLLLGGWVFKIVVGLLDGSLPYR